MIKTALTLTRENIEKYVKYLLLGKTKLSKAMVIIYVTVMLALSAAAVVFSVITGMFWFIAVAVCCLLLIAAAFAFVMYTAKKYTDELYNSNTDRGFDGIEITASCIVLTKGEKNVGIIEWSNVSSVDIVKQTAFITAEGYLLCFEQNSITEGTLDEFMQIVNEKLVKQGD